MSRAATERIPVSEPDLRGAEADYVADAVRSSWISSTGKYLRRFESEFALACGAGTALGTCNGTVALHLALAALGVGPGDEVIVPSLTYVASVNAVRYVGATPVFADVSEDTWCLDPDGVAARVTARTRAVMAVHLYGHPADHVALEAAIAGTEAVLVEDAAEAPFAVGRGRSVGSMGKVAAFSFYGNKLITSGEGGAVVTSDPELAGRLSLLRGQGMDPARRYFFPVVGYNYRMTNVAAALLCAQMERRDAMTAARRELFAHYRRALADVPGLAFQPVASWATPSPWSFPLLVQDESAVDRDGLMRGLDEAGIDTRPFFVPVHDLPPYQADWERQAREGDLVVTARLARQGLTLPTASTFGPEVAERVCSTIRRLLRAGA